MEWQRYTSRPKPPSAVLQTVPPRNQFMAAVTVCSPLADLMGRL